MGIPDRVREFAFALAILVAGSLVAVPASALVSFDWVEVGDPGNPDFGSSGSGSVADFFEMATFEVTIAQYAEFLNAVAADDPNGLWDPLLGLDPPNVTVGIIERQGSAGSYSYVVGLAFSPDASMLVVSYWNALRFANWLHNGQPTGPQGPATTEDGAYTITPAGMTARSITRNPEASVFVPNLDEWLKAARYDPVSASYFDWPTGSNTVPTCSLPSALPDTANCDNVAGGPVEVGSYPGSPSPWGTFDQGGNVWEWNAGPDFGFGFLPFISGGGWSGFFLLLTSPESPETASLHYGFRLARCSTRPAELYFSEPNTGRLRSSNLSGECEAELVTTAAFGVALDREGDKLYWPDYVSGAIRRADYDGSNVEDVVTGEGAARLLDLAIDAPRDKMYWMRHPIPFLASGDLRRANLDGSGVETVLSAGDQLDAVAIDATSQKLYFATSTGTPPVGAIARADLDGSNIEPLLSVGFVFDLALDPIGGKMYWTDLDAPVSVMRSDLDGSNAETLALGNSPFALVGLALDLLDEKIYWSDGAVLNRMDLDGSNLEEVRDDLDPGGIFLALARGPVCLDGIDNDGDGLIDFPQDPGCRNASQTFEDPACDDDIDNDGDGGIDWDGGSGGGTPDSHCGTAWKNREDPAPSPCGLGQELVFLLPLLYVLRLRRRRAG